MAKHIRFADKGTNHFFEIAPLTLTGHVTPGITFYKTQIAVDIDGVKAEINTEFEGADFDMLKEQLQFLYDRRISDFLFSNLDERLKLSAKMDDTGNVLIEFKLYTPDFSTLVSSSINSDTSYLPEIINTLKSIAETVPVGEDTNG